MNEIPMSQGLRPGALVFTAALAIALLVLPRRWMSLPIFIAAAFIPSDQRVIIATLDFSMLRLMILAALARLFLRNEFRPLPLQPMDKAVLAFVASVVVTGTLLHGTLSGFVNRAGVAFDLLGLYFFTRISLRTWSDAVTALTAG